MATLDDELTKHPVWFKGSFNFFGLANVNLFFFYSFYMKIIDMVSESECWDQQKIFTKFSFTIVY